MLETAGRIVGRMAELKGMATQDPMKSSRTRSPTTTSSRTCRFSSTRYPSRPSMEPVCSPRRPPRRRVRRRVQRNRDGGPHHKHLHQQQRLGRDEDQPHKSTLLSALTIKQQHQGVGCLQTPAGNAAAASSGDPYGCLRIRRHNDGTSFSVRFRWVRSNRLCPTPPICGPRTEAECPGSPSLPIR